MDPLTHAISGAVLARALPKQPLPGKQVLLLALLSMAPDIDIVLRAWSDMSYLQHHRGITHSLLMLPLWSWLIFSLLKRKKQPSAMPAYLIGLALLMHILLDLITTFGTMILAPLSHWRASLDLVFIIDPIFTACLLIPLLLAFIPAWRSHARPLAMLSLSLMFSYLALTYYNQQQAIALLKSKQANAQAYHALPLAFSPFNWQLIAQYPDHYVRAGVHLQTGFIGLAGLFSKNFVQRVNSSRMSDADRIDWQSLAAMHTVKDVDQLPGTAFYQWFASYPVVLEHDDQHLVFGDLAFGAGANAVPPSFELRIDLHQTETHHKARAWLIWHSNQATELIQ
ncbi:MAG: metal-dependent hydrolase [Mariprofundus sp.]|nr:metal-dependent hydrolase [Mariprofundus sp.]